MPLRGHRGDVCAPTADGQLIGVGKKSCRDDLLHEAAEIVLIDVAASLWQHDATLFFNELRNQREAVQAFALELEDCL